jgi:cell division protein FtsW
MYRHFSKRKRNNLNHFFKSRSSVAKPDWFLVILIFTIIVFGLAMLSSASSVKSFKEYGSTYYLFWHQVTRGFIPGLLLFLFFYKVDYRKLEKYSIWFFLASVILLFLVFVPGLKANFSSAQSWISLFGYAFQPSEIVKLLLILSLAGWFSYRGREKNADFWNGLLPFIFMLAAISGLIILQPDLGTLVVIVTIALVVYFIAGARIRHLISLILLGLGGFGILIARAPYRAQRLMTFLHPELDPQGIGYHINQAFLAIGSGGWLGLGFGQSRQKFAYLPEVIGDSIFAVMAEELGFIFAVVLVIAFLLLAWRGFILMNQTNNDYGRLIIVGIVAWITFQAFYNIGAMVGLLPLTGIPLPFISYGGSALLASMAAAGILANISRQTK